MRRQDEGTYTCIAENNAGREQASAYLSVIIRKKDLSSISDLQFIFHHFYSKKLFLNQIVYASFRWLFSIFTNILYNFPLNFYKFFYCKNLMFFLKIINYFPYNFSISVSDCISIFRFVGQHILHLKQFLRFLKFKSSEELNVKVKGGTNYRVTWALLGSQANAI